MIRYLGLALLLWSPMIWADEVPEPEDPQPASEEPAEENEETDDDSDDSDEEEEADKEGGCSHFTGIDLGLSMLPLFCFGWVVLSYRKRELDTE